MRNWLEDNWGWLLLIVFGIFVLTAGTIATINETHYEREIGRACRAEAGMVMTVEGRTGCFLLTPVGIVK